MSDDNFQLFSLFLVMRRRLTSHCRNSVCQGLRSNPTKILGIMQLHKLQSREFSQTFLFGFCKHKHTPEIEVSERRL